MRIFYLDLHISVISEFKDVLSKLKIENLEIEGWLLSGHAWVLNKESHTGKVINPDNWTSLNNQLISQFQKKYDEFLKSFDAFFVGYPTSFILLLAKYNKPIIVYNCVRYDLPFCWTNDYEMVDQLNNTLTTLYKGGKLVVISNNLGDHDYFNLAPHGVPSTLIPTLGEYARIKKNKTKKTSLIYSGEAKFKKNRLLTFRSELGRFDWSELGAYESIIHLPYEISTMSMAEHYSSGVPLFFPSISFILDEWEKDNNFLQSKYWLHRQRLEFPSYLENALNKNSNFWWVSRSDFYNTLENVNFYYSFDDLYDKLSNLRTEVLISPSQRILEQRKATALDLWRQCLKTISII